jgi:cytochrome subunit of sulfide dehydrogenase
MSMPMTRLTAALAFVMLSAAAQGADAPPGAASCSGCHAANPRVETPVPPLAGRPAADIASQMVAFKAGQRPGTIMDRIAKGFSEEEIRAIAAWYEGQK